MVERVRIDVECSKEFLREDERGNIVIPIFGSNIFHWKGSIILAGSQLDYKQILVEEIIFDASENYSKQWAHYRCSCSSGSIWS